MGDSGVERAAKLCIVLRRRPARAAVVWSCPRVHGALGHDCAEQQRLLQRDEGRGLGQPVSWYASVRTHRVHVRACMHVRPVLHVRRCVFVDSTTASLMQHANCLLNQIRMLTK